MSNLSRFQIERTVIEQTKIKKEFKNFVFC